jgi:hypothetical protein
VALTSFSELFPSVSHLFQLLTMVREGGPRHLSAVCGVPMIFPYLYHPRSPFQTFKLMPRGTSGSHVCSGGLPTETQRKIFGTEHLTDSSVSLLLRGDNGGTYEGQQNAFGVSNWSWILCSFSCERFRVNRVFWKRVLAHNRAI